MNEVESALAPLFAGLSDGICVSDAEGRLLYLNPAAQRLLGARWPESAGQSACDLLCGRLAAGGATECASHCPLRDPRDPHAAVSFAGRYEQKSAYRWMEEGIQRLPNGKDIRVRCVRMPAPPEAPSQGERHFTIIEDASAELELERRKEDWRSMIAHDLRSPLTSVYATLRLIMDDSSAPAPQPPDPGMVEIGLRNCRRIMEMIDLYLEDAKLEAGAMPVEPTVVELGPLIRDGAEEQSLLAKDRRVEIAVAALPPLRALADPRLLARVLQNVLSNAVKFSIEGGRVEIAARAAGPDRVEIAVRDSGPGIAPEELPHLFDRYHQSRTGRRGALPGTGLGLAFCRLALEAMNGSIGVESSPGAGSVFTLSLPGAP